MNKDTRNAIERATQKARKLLEEDFAAQLEGTFDVLRDGTVAPKAGSHLTPRQVYQRDKIVAGIDHKRAAGMAPAAAVLDTLRDAAFTTLNRFVALKMLEARALTQECITKGELSSGYREYCGMAPGVALLPDGAGYRLYLECLFDDLSTEVKVLFDRRDPASVLWPKRATLEALLGLLNALDSLKVSAEGNVREDETGNATGPRRNVWGEDETIGWVYQFFNGGDERRAMRDASQAPRNSRELAVRNQFFTPRYVVQFLTDNTLGRIWYEMRGGVTALREQCEYMVRHADEVLLGVLSTEKPSSSWIRDVCAGRYESIPESFSFSDSDELAYLINGYETSVALGLGHCGELANRIEAEAYQRGQWEGSAIELWLCLFFKHRALRNDPDRDPGPDEIRQSDDLCRTLREKLVASKVKVVAHRTKKDPRDLRVLDPACGSGHFLLYAFDLLVTIYEEAWADGHDSNPKSEVTGTYLHEDYPDLDALRRALPALILRHNLHGVDIDPRCAQIAQLALWMRAQRAFRDFEIPRGERAPIRRSNIVVAEPLVTDEATLKDFLANLGDAELGRVFTELVETLKLAGDLGLLLRVERLVARGPKRGETAQLFAPPEERIRAALARFVAGTGDLATTRRRLFADDAAQGVGLLETAEKKYDVVLMNPPFGAGSARAKNDFEKAYPRTKNDVYAAFVERGIEVLVPRGRLGAITSRTGFFLSSFQKWREEILLKLAPPAVVADLGAGVLDSAMVETSAYCLEKVS